MRFRGTLNQVNSEGRPVGGGGVKVGLVNGCKSDAGTRMRSCYVNNVDRLVCDIL